jgi:hypothetical protein
MAEYPDGHDDTPEIPDTEYHVHDADRPHPPIIAPPERELPRLPPSDATVLLDATGPDLEQWEHPDGRPAGWDTGENCVVVCPDAGSIQSRTTLSDCQLHVEWATPTEAERVGPGRGNSGLFFMDRYEIQILDCYTYSIYADGYAGAVYGQHPPLANVCRPPGAWQSFDIAWKAPRFDHGELEQPATVTLFHNGVLVLNNAEVYGPTEHKAIGEYRPHGPAPLRLQDHGDRVRFRNLWYRQT